MNVFDYFFDTSKDLNKDFVLGNKETISFKDLYSNALKIACFLREKIGEHHHILLVGENSVFFITAYLGIVKSGNICVPIDPMIESANLEFILNETESKCVFYSKKTTHKFEKFESLIALNESSMLEEIVNQKIVKEVFPKDFDENRTMEILFTSGSTGVPKGVVLSHRNIIANTNSIIKYLNLNQLDRICVVLPFYYCYGLSLLHTHLKVGGSIIINNTFLFLGTVIKDIKEFECTGFAGVPSHFQMLLKKSTSFKNTVFPDLKYVTQAGGKLHDVFIKEFVETFPNVNFNVMYGQTEATARLSYLSSSLVLEKLGSIGKAIPDVTLKIVDKNDLELPDGEIGEIIAKGDNVMQGYYKDIEMSEKTLINGWLHTGDLAKKDKEGFIYIVAREKEIIKVGGKRVSPKEIEEVILSVSEVVDCSIKAFDDEILGESLKAIVVIDNKFEENEIKDKILRKCKDKLALYKIPQMFEFESKMRVKPTGKK
jgi:acyl-CoA synthetase (AMP-forming)/AMP-acid ligase II